MKRLLFSPYAFVMLLVTGHLLYAQGSPAQAVEGPKVQQATPTIQARSSLVILDVVVTDHGHSPVHALRASDFQLREGGAPQTIKSFEEHSAANAAAPPPMAPLPPGVFTNYTPTPTNGPVNILLVDRLNTPLNDQPYLRQQLVAFLHTMRPGTQLAVFGLNTQLVYLQGFTADPVLLLAALESKKNSSRNSPLLNAPVGDTFGSIAEAVADLPAGSAPPEMVANLRQFEAEEASTKTQLRTRITLDAMNTLGRYLAGIAGRKNLIWFSGSFPISILPDGTGDLPNPFAVMADSSELFRGTTNLLSRAQVAVYPIDARGLQVAPMFEASQAASGRYTRDPANFSKDINTFDQKTADEHSTMRQMARDTGGEAFVNTNGLAEAVRRAIDLGSSYYTLTYTPTDANYDGRFRKIQVDLIGRGAELSYRRGYYADPPNTQPGRKQLTSSALAPLSPERQATARTMLRGAPASTQILFKALVVPAGPPTEQAVAEGNLAPSATKGPFRRYSVNYAVVPQHVALLPVGAGSYQAHLEFIVYVYNADGSLLNRVVQGVQAKLGPEDIKALRTGGMQFHQIVSVPAGGDNFLRIAVHDLNVDRIGVLEVPVSSVQKLAVVDVPGATAPTQRPAPSLNTLPK